jgi:hypothetical protein
LNTVLMSWQKMGAQPKEALAGFPASVLLN